jgi:hypothetical protein
MGNSGKNAGNRGHNIVPLSVICFFYQFLLSTAAKRKKPRKEDRKCGVIKPRARITLTPALSYLCGQVITRHAS